jgi:hypothetical protein
MKIKHLIEGWRNNILPPKEQAELIAKVSHTRMSICNQCEHHSKNHNTPLRPDDHCVECGCTLAAKTKCLDCDCPLKKWCRIEKLNE